MGKDSLINKHKGKIEYVKDKVSEALQPERFKSYLKPALSAAGIISWESLKDRNTAEKAANIAYDNIPLIPYGAIIKAVIGREGFVKLALNAFDKMHEAKSLDPSCLNVKYIMDKAENIVDKYEESTGKTGKIADTVRAVCRYKEALDGTSAETVQGFIKSVTTGTFVVTETLVNEITNKYTSKFSIKFKDDHFVLKAPLKAEASLSYDSCDFTENTRSITIKLLKVPILVELSLKKILGIFPFLELSKAVDGAKLITCHLNRIEQLKNNKILTSPYLEHVTIDYMKCEEGKATIKLKAKLEEIFGDMVSGFNI